MGRYWIKTKERAEAIQAHKKLALDALDAGRTARVVNELKTIGEQADLIKNTADAQAGGGGENLAAGKAPATRKKRRSPKSK